MPVITYNCYIKNRFSIGMNVNACFDDSKCSLHNSLRETFVTLSGAVAGFCEGVRAKKTRLLLLHGKTCAGFGSKIFMRFFSSACS